MQSHGLFNAKASDKWKSLQVNTQDSFLPQLLDSLAHPKSDEKAAYTKLVKFSDQTYFQYDRFGILNHTHKPNVYDLYVYRKPNRKDLDIEKLKLTVSLDKKGGIVCDKMDYLERLILLQHKERDIIPIDFTKSMTYKKITVATQTNPFPQDHFIYLSFVNITSNLATPDAFKKNISPIKKYFNQSADFTFNLLRLNNPKKITKKITKAAKKNAFESTFCKGKIYLVLDGHCLKGNDHLSGEFPDELGNIQTHHITIPMLLNSIHRLHIPKTAELDIDVYACEAGLSSPGEPSFIQQLSEALREDGYTSHTVKGNRHNVYGFTQEHPKRVISQSPTDVSVFGEIREPLTSIEKLQNTEPYIRIYELSDEKHHPERNKAIKSLQHYATKICHDAENIMDFKIGYTTLKKHCDSFMKFDSLAKKITQNHPLDMEKDSKRKKLLSVIQQWINHQYNVVTESHEYDKAYQSVLANYTAFQKIDTLTDELPTRQAQALRPM